MAESAGRTPWGRPSTTEYDAMMARYRSDVARAAARGARDTADVAGLSHMVGWAAKLETLPDHAKGIVLARGARVMAEHVRTALAKDMAQGKGGVHWSHLTVRSSAPSETPAVQSPDSPRSYINGLKLANEPTTRYVAEVRLIATAAHSAYLEYGTRNMYPRAPLRRAVARFGRDAVKVATKAALEALDDMMRVRV